MTETLAHEGDLEFARQPVSSCELWIIGRPLRPVFAQTKQVHVPNQNGGVHMGQFGLLTGSDAILCNAEGSSNLWDGEASGFARLLDLLRQRQENEQIVDLNPPVGQEVDDVLTQ